MQNPFSARAPSFNAEAIHATIERALASAGLDTQAGPMREVTETIRRALAGARPTPAAPPFGTDTDADTAVIDVAARVVPPEGEAWQRPAPPLRARQEAGSFETHVFRNAAGSRTYKLYTPAGNADAPRPVMVMLHGCTQSADDFAAGTQMNRLADTHGFLVVYPEQDIQANTSKCWNWFKPQDQLRGGGEPSLIAGIVAEVARRQSADPRRVYVAGLSAGAAMAVVLGETYPELFAGVGVHSGLPYGSAHDIPSALGAMKGGRSGLPELKKLRATAGAPCKTATQAVPLIVFHGDRDHTVQQTNAAHLLQQAQAAHAAQGTPGRGGELRADTQTGVASGGRRFSRTVYSDAEGAAWIESWTLHGAGHAWSGGHPSGSYTDGAGPNASAEMVRFFMALPRAAPAVDPSGLN